MCFRRQPLKLHSFVWLSNNNPFNHSVDFRKLIDGLLSLYVFRDNQIETILFCLGFDYDDILYFMGKIIKYFTLFHLFNDMTLQNYTFEIDRFTNVLSKSLFILKRKNK